MSSKPEPISIANKILKSFLGVHTPLKSDFSGATWSLSSQFSVGETTDKKGNYYTLYAFPIKPELSDEAENTPFYFSFSISLRPDEQIEKLSVKIFKNDDTKAKDSSSIPSELVLRVDWDNNILESKGSSKHAQPHWHIHSYKNVDLFENSSKSDRQTILALIETSYKSSSSSPFMQEMVDSPPSKEGHIPQRILHRKIFPHYRFHLAMLADWDKSRGSLCNKTLTNDLLELWLPQCLEYIKGQLEYILEKIGNPQLSDAGSIE